MNRLCVTGRPAPMARPSVAHWRAGRPAARHVLVSAESSSSTKVLDSTKVVFKCQQPLSFGEQLMVVGESDALGAWNMEEAPLMEWSEGDNWSIELALPRGALEFKLAIQKPDGAQFMESGTNRIMTVETVPLETICTWMDTAATSSMASMDEGDVMSFGASTSTSTSGSEENQSPIEGAWARVLAANPFTGALHAADADLQSSSTARLTHDAAPLPDPAPQPAEPEQDAQLTQGEAPSTSADAAQADDASYAAADVSSTADGAAQEDVVGKDEETDAKAEEPETPPVASWWSEAIKEVEAKVELKQPPAIDENKAPLWTSPIGAIYEPFGLKKDSLSEEEQQPAKGEGDAGAVKEEEAKEPAPQAVEAPLVEDNVPVAEAEPVAELALATASEVEEAAAASSSGAEKEEVVEKEAEVEEEVEEVKSTAEVLKEKGTVVIKQTQAALQPIAEEVVSNAGEKWGAVENKPTFVMYTTATLIGAVVTAWLTYDAMTFLDKVPPLRKFMELVGLGYTCWFYYRYLLFKEGREELVANVESLRRKIGHGDE